MLNECNENRIRNKCTFGVNWCDITTYHHKILYSIKQYDGFCGNTFFLFPKPSYLLPSLSSTPSLPPPRCKRPWCIFESLPRHISTANLACHACASVAMSSSFIKMTHKARPQNTNVGLAIEPLLDKRKRVFILGEENQRILTWLASAGPRFPVHCDDQAFSRCFKRWPCGSHTRGRLLSQKDWKI